MTDLTKPDGGMGTLERQTLGIRTLVAIASSIVVAAIFVGGVTISLKLEMKDNTNAVVRVADRVDEIAKAVDGYGDLKSEVKILRADVTRLQSELEKMKAGK